MTTPRELDNILDKLTKQQTVMRGALEAVLRELNFNEQYLKEAAAQMAEDWVNNKEHFDAP